MKVLFHEEVDNPIFALTIKDSKGTEITGTNTMFEKKEIGQVKKNQVYEISFKQRFLLQSGNYLLSFGCTGYEMDEFVVYQRLYDVTSISVVSEQDTVGVYDMDSEVNVKLVSEE